MTVFLGKILIVDDDVTLRRILTVTLEAEHFQCDAVPDLEAMRQAVKSRSYDAVLLDLILEDEDGLSAIPFLVREVPQTKIIMMSAHGTIEIAVSAMEKGATAFVSKSKDPKNIIDELKKRLANPAPVKNPSNTYGIIGRSQVLADIVATIAQISSSNANVTITGEPGTGKESLARAIHQASSQSKRFEAINCEAMPEHLLEFELFGQKSRRSIFEICINGTLLLQEVDHIPAELQGKLAQILRDKKIFSKEANRIIDLNCRIILTTTKDLSAKVKNGTFQRDLFDNMSVVTLHTPPLRERLEDIPLLLNHFLKFYNEKFAKSVEPPKHELESRLIGYKWPGNVTELRNAVERGVLLSSNDQLKLEDMIPQNISDSDGDENHQDEAFNKTLSEAKQEFERRYLQHLLEATRGNISEMARISGRYRTDIYRLLAKHGVDWEEFRPESTP